jgi:uncharacterized protein YcbK (DUF882 family)
MRGLLRLGLMAAVLFGAAAGAQAAKAAAKPAAKPAAKSAGKGKAPIAKGKKDTAKGKKKVAQKCGKTKNGKTKRCGGTGEWGTFFGESVPASELRTEPLGKPSGHILISAKVVGQAADVQIFRPDGSYDPAALTKLDQVFQCKRTGQTRQIDPRLYEVLSHIQDHFEGKAIELVSGFRYQRNENSRHYHGSAADIIVAGIADTTLREYVRTLDVGGMGIGIYPKSGFIHVDFRAPGRPSYRWTDYSTGEQSSPGKQPPKGFVRPNS